MSVNLEGLEPGSPEYEEALMRAQDEEDEANGNAEADPDKGGEDEPGDDPPEEKPAAAEPAGGEPEKQPAKEPAADANAQTDPAPAQPAAKVAGVASKDGTRVLPYAALQAERRAARHAAAKAEKLQRELEEKTRELEDIKAGKKPAGDAESMSDEDIEKLEQDFPEVAKSVRALRRELDEIKAQKPAKAEEPDPEPADDPVQEAIDTVPMLAEWQATDPEKFQRAIEIDGALQNSRKWKDKPLTERFAHVAKTVAEEFDIEVPDDKPPQPQDQPKSDPKKDAKAAIDNAKRATPNTLSDLKGGATDPTDERIERMSPQRMLNRFTEMSDEEIDRHLRKHG